MTARKCGWRLDQGIIPYCWQDEDLENCGSDCSRYSPGLNVGEATQGGDTDMTVHVKGGGVKKIREEAGMNQRDFGDMLEVNASTVSRWEQGFMGMTEDHFDLLQGLGEIYQVDLERLSG